MKMKQMLLALLVCLLASCGGGSQKTSDEMTISMKTNVPVEELVKDATLIPLETTDDCLLGDLEKIYESDGRLYILDMNRTTVFVFDISGKFLYKIERRGQGPEEYLEVSDFDVMDGVIYVLSRVNKRILAYDENGECVKIIPLKAWYDNLAVEEERVILYANRGNELMYDVAVINHEGEVLGQYLPYQKQSSYRMGQCGSPISKMDDGEYLFTFYFSGKVASLKDEKCDYQYRFSFDVKDRIPEEEMEGMMYDVITDQLRYKDSFKNFKGIAKDKDGNLMMVLSAFLDGKGLRDALCKVDLKNGTYKLYLLGEKIEEKYPYLSGVLSMRGNKCYAYKSPFSMHRMHENLGTPIPEGLAEDDNPVIEIYTLNLD